jgi:hypothetical protein
MLSLMEARRAQGFPDEEVVLGRLAAKWKIVGNSVARQVAFALGLSIRDAWLSDMAHLGDEKSVGQTTAETRHHRAPSIDLDTGKTLGMPIDQDVSAAKITRTKISYVQSTPADELSAKKILTRRNMIRQFDREIIEMDARIKGRNKAGLQD